jgi:2-polyprenyl-3-methyl-5-hydroxy-6-metoxy-1,4-benzoquinol methylase
MSIIDTLNMALDCNDKQEIQRLISKCGELPLRVEDVWKLIDEIWDELGCDNKVFDHEKYRLFYSHPIWLFNGIFIEQDKLSCQHRNAIAEWITNNNENIRLILDYGGGYGTLARFIASRNNEIRVDIYDPHPHELAIKISEKYHNIYFIDIIANNYDCLISTDVLEHCHDPLIVFMEMIHSVKIGGFLIIANNFSPVIKCHLPSTFHLRVTFKYFALLLGLRLIGPCKESHATIYQKVRNTTVNGRTINIFVILSQKLFPFLLLIQSLKRKIANRIR